jgi:hypothetical protein
MGELLALKGGEESHGKRIPAVRSVVERLPTLPQQRIGQRAILFEWATAADRSLALHV